MLIPDFYIIKDFKVNDNQVSADIELNDSHEVYSGHFPGQPVVPGVIQLQIIKELMEKSTNKKLILQRLTFAKYLKMIVPHQTPSLNFQIDFLIGESEIKFSTIIQSENIVFTKVKGHLSI